MIVIQMFFLRKSFWHDILEGFCSADDARDFLKDHDWKQFSENYFVRGTSLAFISQTIPREKIETLTLDWKTWPGSPLAPPYDDEL